MEVRRNSLAHSIMHYLRLHKAYLSLHLKTAMEYRTNFLIQSLFMLVNDFMFAVIFIVLFASFKSINGYTVEYAMTLFGISAIGFGIIAVFFGNRRQMWEMIVEGKLDMFLSMPVDELYHALITRAAYDGIGDMLFGVIIISFYNPSHLILAIVCSIFGAIALLSFMVLIDSLGFFLEHPKAAAWSLNTFILSISSWPIDAYDHAVRTFVYSSTLAFISVVPYHVATAFTWELMMWLVIASIVMLAVSVLLWKFGLRRYESGNMMTTRT